MESIILNLLNLTGEERAAFAVLAPQRFHPDGDGLTVEDWQSAQVILGNPPPECLRGSTALRWLHTRSAGVDPYTAPGVLPSEAALTCSTGAYGHSVSEHLFALLLALMKRLPSYRDQQNRALWRDLGPVKTLLGAQVLVVGTGDLGSSFARLCQTLGASTSGVRRDPAKPAAGIERMYGFEALDTLLPAADVVALTLPQTPGTVRLFDKARLLRMKGDAILLNGGRGSCVDGQALAEVLADGRLWGAGLDVTDPEPLRRASAVRQPRALITPHTAGGNHLADTERRIARIALDNLRRYLRGGAAQPRSLKRPLQKLSAQLLRRQGREGSRGNVKHGFTARLSRPAQAKGGSGKGGQDTGGELRVGVQRQFEFHQGPVLFLPARAAAAEDKAAVGQAAVVPEQLLLREKVHRGVVVGKVVGHGDDRLLDAGPGGPPPPPPQSTPACASAGWSAPDWRRCAPHPGRRGPGWCTAARPGRRGCGGRRRSGPG